MPSYGLATTKYNECSLDSKMEMIYVPDVDTLCRLTDEFDGYMSDCGELTQYIENLTHNEKLTLVIQDMPVPIYILKELAYKQDAIVDFGGAETKKFISLVADVACLYGMWPRADVSHPTSRQAPIKTFNDDKVEGLRRSTVELIKVIGSHKRAIADLRQQQRICWDLSSKSAYKHSLVEAFEKKYAVELGGGNAPQKLRGKLQQLSDEMWDAQDDVTRNQIMYCEMLEKETNIKVSMFQISDRIRNCIQYMLVRRMADCIGKAYTFLQSVHVYRFQNAHVFNNRHLPVIHTMCRMRTGAVADELIQQASKTYTFPNTKEYPVYMRETPKLPAVHIDEKIGRGCTHPNSKTVVGTLRLSGNLNGYHLKISGRTDASSVIPGFFHLNKDLHVKCKLGMFNGDVGFGWTRKSSYSPTKTWGFFIRPPSLTDFTDRSSHQAANPVALGNT
ncbi:uncharacterized protein LOC117334269 [Pecten maximus]|uniref:uncharacterized protein LOC117334269 n=1 Tax=Pecten maximus TaxID=6579 RepID=UPI0014589FE7|nr:uncharacterized protein LOC117334269 [Pecten maximus]